MNSEEQIAFFEKINDRNYLQDGIVVEHRADQLVHGSVAYSSASGYGSVGIGWSHGSCSRTTVFRHTSWNAEQIGNVVFLRRIGPDEGSSDIPFPEVDLYTIILPPQ